MEFILANLRFNNLVIFALTITQTETMKKLTLLVFCIITLNTLFAQAPRNYNALIKEALDLYQNKEYLKSGEKFSEAFYTLGDRGRTNDRYNAACSWALANQSDSAFVQLFKIAKNANYTNLDHITKDTDLNSLHEDKRWKEVIDIVKSNKEKAEINYDRPLIAKLDSIYDEDQKYRIELDSIEKKHGRDSKQVKKQWKIINEKDSLNLIEVTKILDERGWLGRDVIGIKGNSTLFLVIQHADFKTQEKYLPMMREAVLKGKASAGDIALLEDRVALRKGEKQIYGSQIGRNPETGEYYIMPLIDPDNVDNRRAEMGLGPIESYLSNWNLTWDPEEYKKKLPEYEALQKH